MGKLSQSPLTEAVHIVIPGAPIAKKRPRFVRRGPYVAAYNPQETEEGRWLLAARGQIAGPVAGPITLRLLFEMPIPASTSNVGRQRMLAGEVSHTKKPDLDNLIKFALDCLNGEAWSDDSQIVSIVAEKRYSAEPKTIVVF